MTSAVALAALMSSLCFDYLVRFRGSTSLTYAILNAVPAPSRVDLMAVAEPAAAVICRSPIYDDLWRELEPKRKRPCLDLWEVGKKRAEIDALVAQAYGLSLQHFAGVLSTFPNLDRTQPKFPDEPKSFVTRDLALQAFCQLTGSKVPDVGKLMRNIGVDLPEPLKEYRNLAARVNAYRELDAVPYRPTPRGGKAPTDPAFETDVLEVLTDDALTAEEIAEALEDEPKAVYAVLKRLVKDGTVFAEGRGASRRYYVIGDD
jgi:hypothetical protein